LKAGIGVKFGAPLEVGYPFLFNRASQKNWVKEKRKREDVRDSEGLQPRFQAARRLDRVVGHGSGCRTGWGYSVSSNPEAPELQMQERQQFFLNSLSKSDVQENWMQPARMVSRTTGGQKGKLGKKRMFRVAGDRARNKGIARIMEKSKSQMDVQDKRLGNAARSKCTALRHHRSLPSY
jgi:hypothetical protein